MEQSGPTIRIGGLVQIILNSLEKAADDLSEKKESTPEPESFVGSSIDNCNRESYQNANALAEKVQLLTQSYPEDFSVPLAIALHIQDAFKDSIHSGEVHTEKIDQAFQELHRYHQREMLRGIKEEISDEGGWPTPSSQ